MQNIFITGATGNVGIEVIKYLYQHNAPLKIWAGVRQPEKSRAIFKDFPELNFTPFDFEQPQSFAGIFKDMNAVFLLRPPQISDVDKFFKPLIEAMVQAGVKQVIFLSVQGVERSKVIPHYKIEKLIIASGIDYIFVRPGYFMQNLTTTLLPDIINRRAIVLPAGKAVFNWIDVHNIGETAALLFMQFETYRNMAYDITGYENKNFEKVVMRIREITGQNIQYNNVSPFRFFKMKRQDGMSTGMIMVMILLHFLPRFQKAPDVSHFFEVLSGKKPTTLNQFIEREKDKFS